MHMSLSVFFRAFAPHNEPEQSVVEVGLFSLQLLPVVIDEIVIARQKNNVRRKDGIKCVFELL